MSYTGYVRAAKWRAWAVLTPYTFGSLNSPWTAQVQERGNVSFLMPPIRLSFKRVGLQNRRFSSLDGLQTYHPVIFFFLFASVMSLGPNCNDSHVIKVGGFERGEWRRAPHGPIVLSICQAVCPRPPLGFPVWPQSKTDGHNGRMDRQGRPSLCCEPRLTRARLDSFLTFNLVMFTGGIWYYQVAAWFQQLSSACCSECM